VGLIVADTDQLPIALRWAYQDSLNHQADLLFWVETGYKPNQRLNPSDPYDRAMIPAWHSARARIVQSSTPRKLIRDRAVEAVSNMHDHDPQSVFVYTAGAGGSQTRSFPSLRDPQTESYVRARLGDQSYVAIFNTNVPTWPQPIWETYPTTASSSLNVSGDLPRGHYGRRTAW